jgi:two-component system, cell cycle sensor histidine kinase and response regulator CckA
MTRLFGRLRAWLQRIPVADPLEARHAFALQVFALMFFCAVLLVESARAVSAGAFRVSPPSLVNLVNVTISAVAVWWIRRGEYRRAALLFVLGYSVVLAVAISLGGVLFFRDAIKNLAVVLALAALLLGRRALWSTFLFFVAAMGVALARDHGMLGGAGPHPSPAGPNSVFLVSVLSFFILSIVLDRFGLTVREAFADAVARERRMAATTADLRTANAALAAEIQERQRVAQQLRDSEELFRVAFQTSPSAISIVRVTDGVFLAVNQGFTELTGYSEAEVVGRTSEDTRLWVDRAVRDEAARRFSREGSIRELESRFRRKDGSEFVGQVSAQGFDLGGTPHVLAVTRDVTAVKAAEAERQRLQAQLVQAQKLEAVGTLAAGIAHDFNNIIGVVMSYAALAGQAIEPQSAAHADLEQIVDASHRAAGLVRQLLAFSRRQVVQPEPVEPGAVVLEAQSLLRRVLPANIALHTSLDQGVPRVLIDRGQLEQVVMNLSVNARDAMPDGGTLTISTSSLDGQALLTVRDTGTGIPLELHGKIFEPFFTTKPKGQGTGLGLATCYGIVRQAGGRIEVQSEAGAGTTFRVLLPGLSHGEGGEPLPALPPGAEFAPRGSETILLAEDEPLTREAAARLLRSLGYRVLVAADSAAALATARHDREAIDLLLTDLMMPGMRGNELAALLRAEMPRLRVLFMSGYADEAAIESARETGTAILAKPFTVADLAASVRRVLDGP